MSASSPEAAAGLVGPGVRIFKAGQAGWQLESGVACGMLFVFGEAAAWGAGRLRINLYFQRWLVAYWGRLFGECRAN